MGDHFLQRSFDLLIGMIRVGTFSIARSHGDWVFTCRGCGLAKAIDIKHDTATSVVVMGAHVLNCPEGNLDGQLEDLCSAPQAPRVS